MSEMRWLPFGFLAVALGLSLYQISTEVDCGGKDVAFFLRVWFRGAPLMLLFALLIALVVFMRGRRMQGRDLWVGLLLVAWFVVAGVWRFPSTASWDASAETVHLT